jgi:hypothetical protein
MQIASCSQFAQRSKAGPSLRRLAGVGRRADSLKDWLPRFVQRPRSDSSRSCRLLFLVSVIRNKFAQNSHLFL